ncbi:MAG: ferritin-like domain-containing protein [Acidimicrobiales bacterium]|nr:ferritin-like domain-containing protein [Acidimicrobiales bacterium]MCB9394397.1 ferritin-like domain-containing protein [Acidimicrobiaceae bacterium]
MNHLTQPPHAGDAERRLDRRQLFRLGGLTVTTAALVAACGGTESPGIGRVGVAPTTTDLPDGSVDDVVLLRTAASIQHTMIDLYGELRSAAPSSASALIDLLIADHTADAEALNSAVAELGGEPFECGNPRLEELTVPAILGAINGDGAVAPSDDPARDALNTMFAMETYIAESHQAFVPMLSAPALRQAAITIGGEAARHAAVLALEITGRPDGYLEIEAPAEPPQIPTAYALSSLYGQLGGQTLVVGAQDEVGQRQNIALASPSFNTFVYEFTDGTC